MTAPPSGSSPETAYRLFDVEVADRRRLSPSFVRFTLAGDDLDAFADTGYDQRIKLVLPLPGLGVALPEGPDWYARWRALPDARRNPIRTYTVRAVRRSQRQIDVDVVLHADVGPASRWATHATLGDRLAVLGPNAHYPGDRGGIEFDAARAGRTLLLAGDETAVPAVTAIAERLPETARGEVLLEVPTPDDRLDLVAPPGITVTWLPRSGRAHGELLVTSVQAATRRLVAGVRAPVVVPTTPTDEADGETDGETDGDPLWDIPSPRRSQAADGDLYAWLAGEAGAITSLRRHLVRELGVDRRCVAFMGYWRLGRAES